MSVPTGGGGGEDCEEATIVSHGGSVEVERRGRRQKMASKELSTTATNASDQIALINEYLTGPPAQELVRRSGILDHKDSPNGHPLNILDNASGIGTLIFHAL